MKVLIIHPYSFLEYRGGVERYCSILERELSKFFSVSQVNGYYFNFLNQPLPKWKIFKIIKAEKPDILHLHGPSIFATAVGVFGKILGIKTVLTYHANSNPKSYLKKLFVRVNRFFSKYVFNIIIVTSRTYEEKVKRFFPDNKIKMIPLMIEEEFFLDSREKSDCRKELLIGKEKIVLFVGRLDKHHYYKGVETLIKSAKLLPEGIKIILIGEGEEKIKYQKLVSFMGLSNRVEFRGEVKDLMCYYQSADVLVLPSTSDSEGFGLVLLEAMAMQLPVIVSQEAGSAKIIEEKKAGLIVRPNNPETLAQSIQNLLNENSLYQNLVRNGKKFAEEFRIQKNINSFLKVYRNLLTKK